MNITKLILRVIYQRKWWLIIIPCVVIFGTILLTGSDPKEYKSSTTIYTGVASGFTIESNGTKSLDINSVNNTMDNLINVILSTNTLQQVSMRLLVQHLTYGDENKDNRYISAKNYKALLEEVPQEILQLIDKTSEQQSIANLKAYKAKNTNNYLDGVFRWDHPFYSKLALSKIETKRLANSDMIQLSYTCTDPGIAYNTLIIFTDEFIKEYQSLRFQETDNVIEYFKRELQSKSEQLRLAEDALVDFNVKNKVINYEEQTKQMAIQSRDFNLDYSDAVNKLNAANNLIIQLETKIAANANIIRINNDFIQKVNEASNLTFDLTFSDLYSNKPTKNQTQQARDNQTKLKIKIDSINKIIAELNADRYTKEGLIATDIVKQWFEEQLNKAQAEARIKVLEIRKSNLDKDYSDYSPVGAILKRKEREINLLEHSYLNAQNGLNLALTRKQNLMMESAAFKVVSTPNFPVTSQNTKRMIIVIAAAIASIIFLTTLFIIIDLINNTLHNKQRTEKITKTPVIGGLLAPYRKFKKQAKETTILENEYLYLDLKQRLSSQFPNCINIISLNKGVGKSYISNKIFETFTNHGFTVEQVDLSKLDNLNKWQFKIEDICTNKNTSIYIIEHKAIDQSPLEKELIKNGTINLVILSAKQTWSSKENILFNRLKDEQDKAPIYIYLNWMRRDTIEDFLGLLPPHTKFRKFLYKIFQT